MGKPETAAEIADFVLSEGVMEACNRGIVCLDDAMIDSLLSRCRYHLGQYSDVADRLLYHLEMIER